MRDPLNPYARRHLVQLAYDCGARAGDLKQPGPFTPQERRKLVQDTYWLLCAVASVIEWGPVLPGGHRGSDQPQGRDETFEACFLPWYEKEKAVLRVVIAERALRIGYPDRRDMGYSPSSLLKQVAGSEEDLRMFLQSMDVRFGRSRLCKPMMALLNGRSLRTTT
ncbi:hypothetical protein ACQQ2N_06915 [Dokdonella sp. MW10]|uniref:hypothetical protein n=1 Tax=Dokdonella sp. MW10 TaxID=2992926 RepID=UPI003F7E67F4